MSSNNVIASTPVNGRWKGHIAMLFTNIVWGLMSPISKEVLNLGSITSLGLSSVRILGGTALFWIFSLLLPSGVVKKETVEHRDYIKIFMASLLIITSNQALYIVGIGYTSPIDSSVVSTVTPIFTMIFAALLIHERITPLKMLGVVIGLGGALTLVTSGVSSTAENAKNPLLGNSLCMIAQVSAALYYVIFKDIINKYSPFTLMKWMFLFSSITIIPFTVGDVVKIDWHTVPFYAFADIAFIVVFATFIGYLLIPFSQRLLKPTLVSMYNYLQPVTSAFYSVAMGIAVMSGMKIFATALIFIGVWVVTQSKNTQTWSGLFNKTQK